MTNPSPGGATKPRLRQLITDLLRFQFKLLVDAARDVILVPVALIAAGVDALLLRWRAPTLFYRVLQIGERSERMIDLWSVLYQRVGPPNKRVDAVLNDVEAAMRDPQYGKHRAKVLKRWLARRWRQETARISELHGGIAAQRNDQPPPKP